MLRGDHLPVEASDALLHVCAYAVNVDTATMPCNAIPGQARLNGLLLSDKGFRSHIHVRQCTYMACHAMSEDVETLPSSVQRLSVVY